MTLAVLRAPRGTCASCKAKDELLFGQDSTTPDMLCAACYRLIAHTLTRARQTPCDKCGAPAAWRNPKTRRNEYLCGTCHARSGEGVVQNRWAGARLSAPLGVREREECAEKSNTAGTVCRGEVKPRGREAVPLCNRHAGKESWGDEFRERHEKRSGD